MLRSNGMRALGVDYGRKRIGLALSDPTGLLARPWKTIAAAGLDRQLTALAREIQLLSDESDGLGVVVVGLPRRLSGDSNEQTAGVRTLVSRLGSLTTVPIALQDECLSSVEAEQLLARSEKDWRKRKVLLDAAAAAVILQDYLDAQPRPQPEY